MPTPIASDGAASIAIVTDSTAYLPDDVVSALGIVVVPLQVVIDGKAVYESGTSTTAQVIEAIHNAKIVTTSRPNAVEFEQAYRNAQSGGATHIISVHLSSQLSGTYESACLAAARLDIPVTVIDSGTIAMAMGFAVIRAAELAQQGIAPAVIADTVRADCAASEIIFYVDTLEFLRRGGRISSLTSTVGNALNVRPILEMRDGSIQSRERVRTRTRALDILVGIVAAAIARGKSSSANAHVKPNHVTHMIGECDVAVHHVADPEAALALAARIGLECNVPNVAVTECGAVIATHVGPGACAVVVSPHSRSK